MRMLVRVVEYGKLGKLMQDEGLSIGGLAEKIPPRQPGQKAGHWLTAQKVVNASKNREPYSPHARVKKAVADALGVKVSDIFFIVEGGDNNDGVTTKQNFKVSTDVD